MFKNREIEGVVIHRLKRYEDERGWLSELFRSDELAPEFIPVMSYISETLPGIARGPHEHLYQADLFCFVGPSNFNLTLWDNRKTSPTFKHRMVICVGEDNPAQVIVPAGVVHAYKNIGQRDGWVINLANRLYKGSGRVDPVDEIRHEEDPASEFRIDEE